MAKRRTGSSAAKADRKPVPRSTGNGKGNPATAASSAATGFEEKLWAAADKLRGTIDAAEYKHIVLGLLFLKYISDAFAARRADLEILSRDEESDWFCATEKDRRALLEERDEYAAANVFWVPPQARWDQLQAQAKRPDIAKLIDDAMYAIERDNDRLKAVLPADYARRGVPADRLGEIIDLISGIELVKAAHGRGDVLGKVYQYFLRKFALAEGKLGGEFFTPESVVKLLVEMIEPYEGRVFDPCCGSGGMFVQSEKFVEAHGGRATDLSIFGQESNPTTWRLCQMNLAIRGIDAQLGKKNADSFHDNQHRDLRADFILANPPFNVSDWGGDRLRDDARWKYGVPPVGSANYAWIQHFIHHLSPTGIAGFVMANGSMSSNTSGEGEIRRAIVEADLVDCMIALPSQLFFSTGIPACLWFLTRNKAGAGNGAAKSGKRPRLRDRRGETLFIDARKMGTLVTRTLRELTDDEIARIADTYHAWRSADSGRNGRSYEDIPGFCRSATTKDIAEHGYVLTPGRYVGAEDVEDDDEPFEEKMERLRTQLRQYFEESSRLQRTIMKHLGSY